MAMHKDSLDLTTAIPHHEYDETQITIQDYQDEPTMTFEVNDGSKHRTTLTYDELHAAVQIFDDYREARKLLIKD